MAIHLHAHASKGKEERTKTQKSNFRVMAVSSDPQKSPHKHRYKEITMMEERKKPASSNQTRYNFVRSEIMMMNPQQKKQGTCSPKMLKFFTGLLGMCLGGYIIGFPLYWHLSETLNTVGHLSCPPCHCDCIDEPLFTIPQGLNFSFFTDCMKHNPDVSEEMEKSQADLLSEELKQKEAEALGNKHRADATLLEAKKMANQYQKEAEKKCNLGMETCEEAREKAEAVLAEQRELTAIWEMRARQKVWRGRDVTI